MSTKTVEHPGRHEASEEQKKAAGVTDAYTLYRSQSGVASVFVSGDDVDATPEEIQGKLLEDSTVAELRGLAADQGVDLGDATKKADIIAAIESAQA